MEMEKKHMESGKNGKKSLKNMEIEKFRKMMEIWDGKNFFVKKKFNLKKRPS